MSEPESPSRNAQQSQADRTLLGVAPPRLESDADSKQRSPVFVRSGTSVADVEPPPVPRMALPSRPPSRAGSEAFSQAPGGLAERGRAAAWTIAMLNLPARVAGVQVALWKVLVPSSCVVVGVAALLGGALSSAARSAPAAPAVATAAPAASAAPRAAAAVGEPKPALSPPSTPAALSLEGKPADSLNAGELLGLAEGRANGKREALKTLQHRLQESPALAKDKSVQNELLRSAGDGDTARDALAAMARLEGSVGADLLYEVWTSTSVKNDATELSRLLAYSTDVRPKASPALSVALSLRSAETCEQFHPLLPLALKDGDRRSLHLLTKLQSKRGCGPKKTADCFTCLRAAPDELTATINAVKSRRPPSYGAP